MTIEAKFKEFHKKNPQIYDLILHYMREARNAGFNEYSIRAIFHRIRWHVRVETRDKNFDFKISNNYSSRYSRLIMAEHPEFAGFFKTKELRAP